MKQTLLEMVQIILSALDAEEVNSIDDTLEATQIAMIIKQTYLAMSSNRNWASHKRLTKFDHSGTIERPTHLKSPEGLQELQTFLYNATKKPGTIEYREVRFIYPDEFLRMVSNRGINTPNTRSVIDTGGTIINIVTNKPPSYWTTFDDEYIVCDSFDAEVDDALKSSKTQIHAVMFPKFELVDDYVPEMPVDAFAGLLAEAKSVAFVEIKQVANQKAEQESQRQRTWLSRKDWKLQGGARYPNYGRRSAK